MMHPPVEAVKIGFKSSSPIHFTLQLLMMTLLLMTTLLLDDAAVDDDYAADDNDAATVT
jgi:hypothetical protein